MSKLTFQTVPPRGSRKETYTYLHHIKLNRRAVGKIEDRTWRIYLRVLKDETDTANKNCPWKMIRLEVEHDSLEDAKDYLKENFEEVQKKWQIYIH